MSGEPLKGLGLRESGTLTCLRLAEFSLGLSLAILGSSEPLSEFLSPNALGRGQLGLAIR